LYFTIPSYIEYAHAKFSDDNEISLLKLTISSFTELIKKLYFHTLLGKPPAGKQGCNLHEYVHKCVHINVLAEHLEKFLILCKHNQSSSYHVNTHTFTQMTTWLYQ
jgi:hypothetical protein